MIIVAERHPVHQGISQWGNSAANIYTCGLLDPIALTSFLCSSGSRRPSEVIIFCRSEARGRAQLMVTVLQGAAPDLPVALAVHPVTAQAIAVAAGAAVNLGRTGAELVDTALWLCAQLEAGVLLESVAGLKHPNPSFGQHVRSILPWRPRFLVWMGDRPHVVTLAKGAVELPVGEGGLVVDDNPAGEALGTGSDRPLELVSAITDVRREYGAPGAEWTFLPTTPSPLAPDASCPSCGARLAVPACPMCHVRTVPKEVRP